MVAMAKIIKQTQKKKRWPVVVGVVLAAMLVAYLIFMQPINSFVMTMFGYSSQQDESESDVPAYMAASLEANAKISSGDTETANEIFDKSIANTESLVEKGDFEIQRAVSFGDSGYTQQALEASLAAKDYYEQANSDLVIFGYYFMAKYYEQLEQYKEALDSHKKIVELYESSSSTGADFNTDFFDMEHHKQMIKDLETRQ